MSEDLIIFEFTKNCNLDQWKIVNDEVMGGISMGLIQIDPNGNGVFSGHVSLKNNGGFSLLRHDFERIAVDNYSSFKIRLKGDGKKYQFRCKSSGHQRHSYIYSFNPGKEWKTITIPFEKMQPVFRGDSLKMPNYHGDFLAHVALLIGNNIEEDFSLEIDSIQLK